MQPEAVVERFKYAAHRSSLTRYICTTELRELLCDASPRHTLIWARCPRRSKSDPLKTAYFSVSANSSGNTVRLMAPDFVVPYCLSGKRGKSVEAFGVKHLFGPGLVFFRVNLAEVKRQGLTRNMIKYTDWALKPTV